MVPTEPADTDGPYTPVKATVWQLKMTKMQAMMGPWPQDLTY
jgi:hypothetical protein